MPVTKPGKENCEDVTKFRPISLLNTGGKVLEKVLISRINHVFSHDVMNRNQYGFMPQRSTIDATMAVKEFVAESLVAGEVMVLVSLYVKGTFDAAWWPNVLNCLRACGCHKNLYN
jgi:hypothetical protein